MDRETALLIAIVAPFALLLVPDSVAWLLSIVRGGQDV